MVVFATFYAEWIHKTQVVPHREDGNQRGNATNALRLHRDTKEGLDTLLFCALRLPALEGSSLPARSVLLLLRGERSQDVGVVTTRERDL